MLVPFDPLTSSQPRSADAVAAVSTRNPSRELPRTRRLTALVTDVLAGNRAGGPLAFVCPPEPKTPSAAEVAQT